MSYTWLWITIQSSFFDGVVVLPSCCLNSFHVISRFVDLDLDLDLVGLVVVVVMLLLFVVVDDDDDDEDVKEDSDSDLVRFTLFSVGVVSCSSCLRLLLVEDPKK